MQPIMQPIWKTPGRSAIDAVASFVGSYSLGILITNRMFVAGHYSQRDAAIIATGFSTVSVTFMIIVARTLGLMDIWNVYFLTTISVTFIVTAITVRLPPLSKLNPGADLPEPKIENGKRLETACKAGLTTAREAPGLIKNIHSTFVDGLKMAMSILPSIMSIGVAGLLLAKYTPVFEWIGWVFYPFIAVWGMEDALALSQASAAGLAEMFLPALLMKDALLEARFVTGIICVSSILFFSASIPCILSTKIPISIVQIVSIWFVRTALSLFISVPIVKLIL
ncbi:YjiH family protein [Enterovibrio nigricans]